MGVVPLQFAKTAVGETEPPEQIGDRGFNVRLVTEGGALTVTVCIADEKVPQLFVIFNLIA
jgi:hypothetical protein